MPNTTNYGFDYESPTSLPGITLTSGPSGASPILAVQVDAALTSVEAKTDVNALDIAANASDIAANASNIAMLDARIQVGVELMSFTSVDNETLSVNFPVAFPDVPIVHTNINSGSGETARWTVRAINITTTGFQIFAFACTAGDTATWTDVEIGWTAVT